MGGEYNIHGGEGKIFNRVQILVGEEGAEKWSCGRRGRVFGKGLMCDSGNEGRRYKQIFYVNIYLSV
jgi:hypothetical protein